MQDPKKLQMHPRMKAKLKEVQHKVQNWIKLDNLKVVDPAKTTKQKSPKQPPTIDNKRFMQFEKNESFANNDAVSLQ
jgi:hypothetical protein